MNNIYQKLFLNSETTFTKKTNHTEDFYRTYGDGEKHANNVCRNIIKKINIFFGFVRLFDIDTNAHLVV